MYPTLPIELRDPTADINCPDLFEEDVALSFYETPSLSLLDDEEEKKMPSLSLPPYSLPPSLSENPTPKRMQIQEKSFDPSNFPLSINCIPKERKNNITPQDQNKRSKVHKDASKCGTKRKRDQTSQPHRKRSKIQRRLKTARILIKSTKQKPNEMDKYKMEGNYTQRERALKFLQKGNPICRAILFLSHNAIGATIDTNTCDIEIFNLFTLVTGVEHVLRKFRSRTACKFHQSFFFSHLSIQRIGKIGKKG